MRQGCEKGEEVSRIFFSEKTVHVYIFNIFKDSWVNVLRTPSYVMQTYREYTRFNSKVTDWLVRLPPDTPETITGMAAIVDYLYDTLDDILNVILRDGDMNDRFRFVLQVEGLTQPISLPFMSRFELTPDRIMDEVCRVLNSNQDLELNQHFKINLVHVANPMTARGRKNDYRKFLTSQDRYKKTKSLVKITNKDPMCYICTIKSLAQ